MWIRRPRRLFWRSGGVTLAAKCVAQQVGIMGLFHTTDSSNLLSIFQSGSLYPTYDLRKMRISYQGYTENDDKEDDEWGGGQFNGVYLGYWTKLQSNLLWNDPKSPFRSIIGSSEIALVMNTRLLERDDYHLNLRDQNGYLNEYSYTRQTLPSANILNDSAVINEVVFHCPIKLSDALLEIWILTDTQQNYQIAVNKLLERFKEHPDLWLQVKSKLAPFSARIPSRDYSDGCDDAKWIDRTKKESCIPNFCSAYNGPATDNPQVIASLPTYQQIAVNCGIAPSVLTKINNSDAIRAAIFEQEQKRVKLPSFITPPIYLPPFSTISKK